MYRLLIADDEESIREGVADFVRGRCPGWQVVALARDGREALKLAQDTLPDAVLTDITMPHVNGLEFLESLSDILPDAKLLVLSGYDQFEYAVQAMRLGVSDYLLKPLDTSKLVKALEQFSRELDEQALRWQQIETLRSNTQKNNEMELQRYFRAAVQGEQPPELTGANAVYIRPENCYCCVLCSGMNEDAQLLQQQLEQRFYGAMYTVCLHMGSPMRQVIVFCAPHSARSGLFCMLSHALTSIAVVCRRMLGKTVRFFIGRIVDEPRQLEVSYRQCLQAQRFAFLEHSMPVTTYEDVLESRLLPCPELPETLLRDIPAAVHCQSQPVFQQKCQELFGWFEDSRIRDAAFMRMCVLRVCYAILQKSDADMSMSYYEFTNFQNEIMAAESLAELRECLENFVSLYWLRQQGEEPPQRRLADRVAEIVQEHISDMDFSLDHVAAALFISPNYLRQLFKQETGQTFTEYLTAQRMEYAHMLLGNPNVKVLDAAQQAGYADSRYFSVCFKKFYHMTPSEYRASVLPGSAD